MQLSSATLSPKSKKQKNIHPPKYLIFAEIELSSFRIENILILLKMELLS